MSQRRLLLVVGVLFVGSVAALAARYGGRAFLEAIGQAEPSFSTDEALLHQTSRYLQTLRAELDSLPQIEGTRARKAEALGCSVDSGDLFQPSVRREWLLRGAKGMDVARDLAADLRRRGWTGGALAEDHGELTKVYASWSGQIAIDVFLLEQDYPEEDNVVMLESEVKGARPCRLDE